MHMRTLKFRNTCACVYPTEIYFIMAVCEHSFWKDKLINFLYLMISYLCRKCANLLLNTWSNIITWNQKLPSRSGNSKCNLAKSLWVAYWPYSEQGHTLANISYALSHITYTHTYTHTIYFSSQVLILCHYIPRSQQHSHKQLSELI